MSHASSGVFWPVFELADLAGGHRRCGVIGVFVCYLDDSDHRLTNVVTLAGYLGRLEAWKEFEAAVEPIFGAYSVGVLHTKDLHNTDGDFKGWSRIKKASFISEIYNVARSYVNYGISISARKSLAKQFVRERPKESRTSAYGMCFGAIMHNIIYSNTLGARVQKNGVSFIVEKGHRNNSEIEAWFHRRSKRSPYVGAARSITFDDKASSRALQIADFMAFYSRRFEANSDRFDGKLSLPLEGLYTIACRRVAHFHKIMSGEIRRATMAEALNPKPFPPLLPVGGFVPLHAQTPSQPDQPQALERS